MLTKHRCVSTYYNRRGTLLCLFNLYFPRTELDHIAIGSEVTLWNCDFDNIWSLKAFA